MNRDRIRSYHNEEVRLLIEMLKCIKRHKSNGGATFIDLETNFKRHGYNYEGEFSCTMPGEKEIILYWEGWRAEAFCLIGLLIEAGFVEKRWINPMAYDGKNPGEYLPIIYNLNDIKQGGWLPILFTITQEGDVCLGNL